MDELNNLNITLAAVDSKLTGIGARTGEADCRRSQKVKSDLEARVMSWNETRPSTQDLLNSGYLTEVDSFSKMLHGVAALLPDLAQAVPYWVDDASVRESLQACAPSPDRSDAGCVSRAP